MKQEWQHNNKLTLQDLQHSKPSHNIANFSPRIFKHEQYPKSRPQSPSVYIEHNPLTNPSINRLKSSTFIIGQPVQYTQNPTLPTHYPAFRPNILDINKNIGINLSHKPHKYFSQQKNQPTIIINTKNIEWSPNKNNTNSIQNFAKSTNSFFPHSISPTQQNINKYTINNQYFPMQIKVPNMQMNNQMVSYQVYSRSLQQTNKWILKYYTLNQQIKQIQSTKNKTKSSNQTKNSVQYQSNKNITKIREQNRQLKNKIKRLQQNKTKLFQYIIKIVQKRKEKTLQQCLQLLNNYKQLHQ